MEKTLFENRIRWMTVKATAEYLGCSEQAVRAMIYRGTLNHYKLGRRTYLSLSEIDTTIKNSIQKGGIYGGQKSDR